jgi:hypothetical protein
MDIETVLVFNKIDTLDEVTLDEQLYMQHVPANWIRCLRVSLQRRRVDKLKNAGQSEHVFRLLRCWKSTGNHLNLLTS